MPARWQGKDLKWIPVVSAFCWLLFFFLLTTVLYGVLDGVSLVVGIATILSFLAAAFKDHSAWLLDKWVNWIHLYVHLALIWLLIVLGVFILAWPKPTATVVN
jgi:hypothetical protein